MNFDLKPGASVGVVDLGEERNAVRQKITLPYKEDVVEFMEVKEYVDYFGDGIQLKAIYESNKLVAIEFYEGHVLFDGLNLFSSDLNNVLERVKHLYPEVEITGTEFTCKEGLLGTYNEEENRLISVMVSTYEYCNKPVGEVDMEALLKYIYDLNQE